MIVTFYGAAREVTGSMHLIATSKDNILLDCGMFQGRRKEAQAKNTVMPLDPSLITNVLLSHAHIDHSGRIPLLTKNGFKGDIVCTRSTMDTSRLLLKDSAHIQESDASYLNYKTAKRFLERCARHAGPHQMCEPEIKEIRSRLKVKGHKLNDKVIKDLLLEHNLNIVEPLYTMEDAEDSLQFFRGVPYQHPVTVGHRVTCTFYDAGHILGSSMVALNLEENGRKYTILFTGDVGRFDKPIIEDPTLNFDGKDRNVDLLIIESTYGDRTHQPVQDLKDSLKQVITETVHRGGSVIIPSFAYGRTQELIYFLHELYMNNEVPKVPVYVDSPLATEITRVFGEHPEVYDRETREVFLKQGVNPFTFPMLRFVETVEESMALNRDKTPHIVLAGSGMCEGGRILHHLRHKIHNELNTILIVGYMAQNTLGRRIQELGQKYEASGRKGNPPLLKFYNKEYPLKARVVKIDGFSAHADREELHTFIKKSNLKIKNVAVVHGEEDQALSFAGYLEKDGYKVFVPKRGQSLRIS